MLTFNSKFCTGWIKKHKVYICFLVRTNRYAEIHLRNLLTRTPTL